MKTVSSRIVVTLVLTAAGPSAVSEALEQMIVTGVYGESLRQDTTADVSVISRTDIEQRNPVTATDLLRSEPGILINQQGGPGGINELFIRGSEPNFVTVLVDGVTINDPSNSRGGSVNFNTLSPDMIERIEIVKGPQSSIYGSGSLAGAIHIITRKPSKDWQQQLKLEVGEEQYQQASYQLSGSTDRLAVSLGVQTLDAGHIVEHNRLESHSANLGVEWDISDKHSLSLHGRYQKEQRRHLPEQSGGDLFATAYNLDLNEGSDTSSRLAWKAQWHPLWQSELSVAHFKRDNQLDSPGVAPYFAVPPRLEESTFRNTDWQWLNKIGDDSSLWLNAGLDYQQEKGHSQGYLDYGFLLPTNFILERDTLGLFANLNWRSSRDWLVQLSTRTDRSETDPITTSNLLDDTQDTFQVGLRSPQLFNLFSMSANWGQAYKLPSFFALGHPLVGNPELEPEKSEGWDIQLDFVPAKNQTLSLSIFQIDYKDLVDFDQEQFKNVNRSRVNTQGSEIDWRWQPLDTFGLRMTATYTDIDVEHNASKLSGRPQWVAGVGLDYQILDSLSTHLEYRWNDQRFGGSLHSGQSETYVLGAYSRCDLNLLWQIHPQIQASLHIDNVLDEDYQESVGFSGPGRFLRLGMNFSI